MFIRLNQATDLEVKINTFFQANRSNIISLTNFSWKREDIDGEGCSIFKVGQYYFAMYLAILIYLEIQLGIPRTAQYYLDKYNIRVLQDRFACNGISLSNVFNDFGIGAILTTQGLGEDGIEFIGIEESFIVEPEFDADPVTPPDTSISIIDILEQIVQEGEVGANGTCELLITL